MVQIGHCDAYGEYNSLQKVQGEEHIVNLCFSFLILNLFGSWDSSFILELNCLLFHELYNIRGLRFDKDYDIYTITALVLDFSWIILQKFVVKIIEFI